MNIPRQKPFGKVWESIRRDSNDHIPGFHTTTIIAVFALVVLLRLMSSIYVMRPFGHPGEAVGIARGISPAVWSMWAMLRDMWHHDEGALSGLECEYGWLGPMLCLCMGLLLVFMFLKRYTEPYRVTWQPLDTVMFWTSSVLITALLIATVAAGMEEPIKKADYERAFIEIEEKGLTTDYSRYLQYWHLRRTGQVIPDDLKRSSDVMF